MMTTPPRAPRPLRLEINEEVRCGLKTRERAVPAGVSRDWMIEMIELLDAHGYRADEILLESWSRDGEGRLVTERLLPGLADRVRNRQLVILRSEIEPGDFVTVGDNDLTWRIIEFGRANGSASVLVESGQSGRRQIFPMEKVRLYAKGKDNGHAPE